MESTQLVIRKAANIIELSPDGKSSLPIPLRRLVEPPLTYTYQRRLFGVDKYDPLTGISRPMQFEDRRLYKYDEKGRFCCGVGFLPKLSKILSSNGYSINILDKNPPHKRPNRYSINWEAIFENFTLRPKQDECLLSIANSEFGVVDASCGFGKTSIIAMLCLAYPNAMIDIVTKRLDLVNKTTTYLTRFLPSIGQIGGGIKQLGSRITVYSADSLHYSTGEADFLIADEAHELLTPSYSSELAKYRYSRNYAFTATPEGRGDKADAKLESLFGPIIFSLDYAEAVKLGLVVPIRVEWLSCDYSFNPAENKEDVPKKRHGLWRHEARNLDIANKAREYKDDQVLILVESIEHAIYLKAKLPEFELCYGELDIADITTYENKKLLPKGYIPLNPTKREQMRRAFEDGTLRKVIATDVWSTGVDFLSLQVLIRADARASNIMDTQAPGRVSRITDDKQVGILIDCFDKFDKSLHQKALKRSRNYKEKKWEQVFPSKRKIFNERTSNVDCT